MRHWHIIDSCWSRGRRVGDNLLNIKCGKEYNKVVAFRTASVLNISSVPTPINAEWLYTINF